MLNKIVFKDILSESEHYILEVTERKVVIGQTILLH